MANIDSFIQKLHKRLEQATRVAASKGLIELKASVSKSGPEPSEPGEPPHEQSGGLVEGMEAKTQGMETTFISNDGDSAFLEFGTQYMPPRPFMRPHRNEMKTEFVKNIAKELRRIC